MWKERRSCVVAGGHSRSRLDPERANFIVAPAHGLEGGIIVAKLTLTAQEVLTLKDCHTTLSVVLEGERKKKKNKKCIRVVFPVVRVFSDHLTNTPDTGEMMTFSEEQPKT